MKPHDAAHRFLHSSSSHMNAGLYIHIPFCRSKCRYCAFYSVASADEAAAYIDAAAKEMVLYESEFGPFDTIYLGGGTPSVLAPRNLGTIIESARNSFSFAPGAEITIEANPCDITPSYAESLLSLGINRISIGIQSFTDSILAFLGRRHTSRMAEDAVDIVKKSGFSNISLDLIYGVPNQSLASWEETLVRALSCKPQHVSCYQLTFESDTPLGRLQKKKLIGGISDSVEYEFFMTTSDVLRSSGFLHYEISNFSSSASFRSRHNQKYWDHTPYLGIGPSSHSYLGGRRWWNHRSVHKYIGALQKCKKPVAGHETLSPEDYTMESVFLGLRTAEGLDEKCLPWFQEGEISKNTVSSFQTLSASGFITSRNGRICPTTKGMAVADSIAASLINTL